MGDLSGFKVGYADFSMGTKLQSIKLGDSDSEYSNGNLTELYLGNNVLLRTLDVRNCPNLGQGDMKTVDISGCKNIENVYFDGTTITGVELPIGGILKKLHLPSTVTNLTIRDQTALEELVIPSYANISTLWLDNVGSEIDALEILQEIPANSRVRLINIYMEAQDAEEIKDLLDLLDTMRGLDEYGNNLPTAQISGEIHATALTNYDIEDFTARYPYINYTADTITTLPFFTVYFYNGDTLLQTVEHVRQGATAVYTGATPQSGNIAYSFVGWNPQPTDVQANVSCYAQFAEVWDVTEITDSWDEIIAACNNGTYADKYKPGQYKPLDLGTQGIVNMQIVGVEKDTLAAGGGSAPITWVSKELINSGHRMNPGLAGDSGNRTPGTGTIGGWELSEMRSWLKNTIKPLIPSNVRSAIKEVTKYSRIYNAAEQAVNTVPTTDDVWIPSCREVGFGVETEGPVYSRAFNGNAARIKYKIGASSASWWWLRSAGGNYRFYNVSSGGNSYNGTDAIAEGAVALGFCT